MFDIVLILFILFIGSFVQGISGFGLGLVSMGLLSIFLSVKDSTLILLTLTVILSSHVLLKLRNYIIWKDIVPLLIGSLVGRVLSFVFLLYFGDTTEMKKMLGIVLIGMVIFLMVKRHSEKVINNANHPIAPLLLGLVGGFIGGAFAVGGPFYVLYLLMRYEDKRHYHANLQTTFIFVNVFTILLHGFQGDLTKTYFIYVIVGSIIVWIGAKLGLKWFERMPIHVIQKLVYIIIILAGLNLIIFS
nr:sulfite exporter TauE/SafE family protein [Paenibacillus bovis]